MNDTKRAVIYTRVSRDDSGEGKSNERQAEDCRTFARLRGWTVVEQVDDISTSAYSGKKRAGWERVKEMMKDGSADVVIAWKMDRVTRTVRELTDIIALSRETGVPIATTEGDFDLSTEAGKAVATILGAVAEMEVERKGARQKRANAQRRAEGHRWSSGWRPFGYEMDGTLVPVEAEMIKQAAQDVLGGTSLKEVARQWRASGVSTPRSEKGAEGWTHNGVRSILLNPRNAGLNTYKGEVVGKGNWEPILTEEEHTRLVALLTNPARKTNKTNGRQPANLLSGIAVCGICGEKVTAGTTGKHTQKNGVRISSTRVGVYKCPNNHLLTERVPVEKLIKRIFNFALTQTTDATRLMPIDKAEGQDVEALLTEAQTIRNSQSDLADSFAAGNISLDMMEKANKGLNARLTEIESLIETGRTGSLNGRELVLQNAKRFMEADVKTQRAILERTTAIRLYPKGRGRQVVPVDQQVEMDIITYWKDGTQRVVRAIDERPKQAAQN